MAVRACTSHLARWSQLTQLATPPSWASAPIVGVFVVTGRHCGHFVGLRTAVAFCLLLVDLLPDCISCDPTEPELEPAPDLEDQVSS